MNRAERGAGSPGLFGDCRALATLTILRPSAWQPADRPREPRRRACTYEVRNIFGVFEFDPFSLNPYFEPLVPGGVDAVNVTSECPRPFSSLGGLLSGEGEGTLREFRI